MFHLVLQVLPGGAYWFLVVVLKATIAEKKAICFFVSLQVKPKLHEATCRRQQFECIFSSSIVSMLRAFQSAMFTTNTSRFKRSTHPDKRTGFLCASSLKAAEGRKEERRIDMNCNNLLWQAGKNKMNKVAEKENVMKKTIENLYEEKRRRKRKRTTNMNCNNPRLAARENKINKLAEK